ncbi:hypothetical protein RhiirA5_428173 [Rhizophagus irregularis]|uniref:Uncharacterized protein n=1 Tax=Rhizophagus irregularis TaxID=588596 RepID=A0A2N0P0T6_9GLOM|nr:hypothetical protein RhiirA5_428173 [Rhizophagus irregularis]
MSIFKEKINGTTLGKIFKFELKCREIKDKIDSTYSTSIFSSKRKKQSVTLLTEEIPTVEKRKYLVYKIFKDWKCSFYEQCDETFDHM